MIEVGYHNLRFITLICPILRIEQALTASVIFISI